MGQENKQKLQQIRVQRIKKVIQKQQIDDTEIYYSYLNKINNSGISKNRRLFFLFHLKSIGYINQIPKGQYLPFAPNLPSLKAQVKLQDIEKVSYEKQMLKIIFNKNNKKNTWEFKCVNYDQAKLWGKKIQTSQKEMMDLQNSNAYPAKPITVDRYKVQELADSKPQSEAKMDQSIGANYGVDKRQNNALSSLQNLESNIEANKELDSAVRNNGSLKQPIKNESEEQEQDIESNKQKQRKLQDEKRKKQQQKSRKLRQQYLSKIKQEKRTQQKMKQKTQLPKHKAQDLQRQWSYQFAKSHNEFQIVQKFKKYVQALSSQIINELGLKEKRRQHHPKSISTTTLQYDINGIILKLFLTQLSQINFSYNFADQQTIVSNQQSKLSSHQFKNYQYILTLTQNKGKIRIPLSMLTQYKGFTVFAQSSIPIGQNYNNIPYKQLQILQGQSRINNSIFQQDSLPNIKKIVPLHNKTYQKLSRAENSYKKFDLWYIQGLNYYLPHDFNNFNKEKGQQRLRKELIQDDECQNLVLHGQDMCSVVSNLKPPQHLLDGISQLKSISKLVLERVDFLVDQLHSAEEYFTNSYELSQIMHHCGINMRYLGVVYQKLRLDWLKKIIMSQICARCCKKQLNFELQDCILNLPQQNLENDDQPQKKLVADFINKVFGKKQQSEAMWKKLSCQARFDFQLEINKDQLNKPYLLQALQYHCCIRINSLTDNTNYANNEENKQFQKVGSKLTGSSMLKIASRIKINYNQNQQQLFQCPNPFSSNDIQFVVKSKVYDVSFTELYTQINNKLHEYTPQSFQQLSMILNLERVQTIPSHFKMSQMFENILTYLINWISPQQMPKIYQLLQGEQDLPSKLLYSVKLAKIRWALKGGDAKKSEKFKDQLVNHINKWIGECHPILTQLYQIYANYYQKLKDQQNEAVKYCKNAINNQRKVIGPNHNRIANSYYLFGSVYRSFGKKQNAINNLQFAQEIIIKNNNKQSKAYGKVCLQIGQLYLSVNKIEKAQELAFTAMGILQRFQSPQSYIQSIELLCRCYQLKNDEKSWETYKQLVQNTLIYQVSHFIDEIQLTERIIKVCILPSLLEVGDRAEQILKIIQQLHETTRVPNMAYNFLKDRIQDKSFPQSFIQALSTIDDTLYEVQVNGVLTRWKGFQSLANKSFLSKVGFNLANRGFNFVVTLEALNIFLGSFIEGVLCDQ